MKTLMFSCKEYDKTFFTQANNELQLDIDYQTSRLDEQTAKLCAGYQNVCVFVNDQVNAEVISVLAQHQVKHIALRCAGYNNVDLAAACHHGLTVSRVPAYSPEAVAEHTMALILTLNRKIHKAYNRVRENNFSLEGLLGFNLNAKTVGVVGTGRIGQSVIRILQGFGCQVLCYDPYPDPALTDHVNLSYCSLQELFQNSDIVTLHCPLNHDSHHMINENTIEMMKDSVMLINTSRGGLIDTPAVIRALKKRKIGYLGLDVYEMESELFFEDKSLDILQDDVFQRLSGFPNVIITGHQGFFTDEALQQIASTTLSNIALFNQGNFDGDTFLPCPTKECAR